VQTATKTYSQVSQKSHRDELILKHLHLVRHTVSRLLAHLPPGMDLENLESAGTLGLVEAANKFDPNRGTRFDTFAHNRIRGAVLDELRRNCPFPQHLLEKMAKVRQAYKELPPPVSIEAIIQTTGLTAEEVSDCLAGMRMARLLSWDNLAENNIPSGIQQNSAPDSLAEQSEQKYLLARAIANLKERERLAVTLYYLEDLRLKEIGQILKLSESRVSRVLSGALFNLGEYLRDYGV
jgi:RNA polymerase sigma factor for flagellar operon FliA